MKNLVRKTFLLFFVLLLISADSKAQNNLEKIKEMANTLNKYGIEGYQAPEWNVPIWIDGAGKETEAIKLSDHEGKFKIIYCFQAWCPGCHSRGLPALKKMVESLKDNDKVEFMAIQTVFEGAHANTLERVKEIQKEFDLKIPFGHDVGDDTTRNISNVMFNYRTGGTPWFIFIDQKGTVVFNDFHLNTENAIEYLKEIK